MNLILSLIARVKAFFLKEEPRVEHALGMFQSAMDKLAHVASHHGDAAAAHMADAMASMDLAQIAGQEAARANAIGSRIANLINPPEAAEAKVQVAGSGEANSAPVTTGAETGSAPA